MDVIDRFFEQPEETEPVNEPPGSFARYDTDVLSKSVDVVGSPEVRLQVQAPTAKATQSQDAGKLVLYLKVADVAPERHGEGGAQSGGAGAGTKCGPAVHGDDAGVRAPVREGPQDPAAGRRCIPELPRQQRSRRGRDHHYRRWRNGADLPVQSMTLPSIQRVPDSKGGAPGNSAPGGNGGGAGTPSAAGSDNGNNNDKGSDKSSPGDTAQAAPTVTNASSATTTPLPDTGGPQLGLLAAGLLLVVLGAHLLARRRRDSLT